MVAPVKEIALLLEVITNSEPDRVEVKYENCEFVRSMGLAKTAYRNNEYSDHGFTMHSSNYEASPKSTRIQALFSPL